MENNSKNSESILLYKSEIDKTNWYVNETESVIMVFKDGVKYGEMDIRYVIPYIPSSNKLNKTDQLIKYINKEIPFKYRKHVRKIISSIYLDILVKISRNESRIDIGGYIYNFRTYCSMSLPYIFSTNDKYTKKLLLYVIDVLARIGFTCITFSNDNFLGDDRLSTHIRVSWDDYFDKIDIDKI